MSLLFVYLLCLSPFWNTTDSNLKWQMKRIKEKLRQRRARVRDTIKKRKSIKEILPKEDANFYFLFSTSGKRL